MLISQMKVITNAYHVLNLNVKFAITIYALNAFIMIICNFLLYKIKLLFLKNKYRQTDNNTCTTYCDQNIGYYVDYGDDISMKCVPCST